MVPALHKFHILVTLLVLTTSSVKVVVPERALLEPAVFHKLLPNRVALVVAVRILLVRFRAVLQLFQVMATLVEHIRELQPMALVVAVEQEQLELRHLLLLVLLAVLVLRTQSQVHP